MRFTLPASGSPHCSWPAPAQAAFPGAPGPIAYPHVLINEGSDTGGLLAHGPRKRDAPVELTDRPKRQQPLLLAQRPPGRLLPATTTRA